MNGADELKKYIRPGVGTLILGGVLIAIGVCVAVSVSIGAGLIMLALALLCNIGTIIELSRWSDTLKIFEQSGLMDEAVANFNAAIPHLDGELLLGEKYLFGKRSGLILSYNEIRNAHQYIHKTNFAEDSRKLRVVLTSGKSIDLCKLKVRGKSDDALKAALVAMIEKNGAMTIGYGR